MQCDSTSGTSRTCIHTSIEVASSSIHAFQFGVELDFIV